MPKLEMDDNTSTAVCICTIAVCIAAVLLFLIYQSYSVEREAIQAGLVQKQVPGSANKFWSKPDQ